MTTTGDVLDRPHTRLRPGVGPARHRRVGAAVAAVAIAIALVVPALVIGDRVAEQTIALPNRSDPTVQAEEARLAKVMNASGLFGAEADCVAELIWQEGPASYVWAGCITSPSSTSVDTVVPARIIGTTVEYPRDPTYSADSARLFPASADRAFALAHPTP